MMVRGTDLVMGQGMDLAMDREKVRGMEQAFRLLVIQWRLMERDLVQETVPDLVLVMDLGLVRGMGLAMDLGMVQEMEQAFLLLVIQ